MNDTSDPDVRRILALAFDRAWESYYLHGRRTIKREAAAPELAKRIVEVSRSGELTEHRLAEAGLHHLQTLTRAMATAKTKDTKDPPS
jgi:hypothetical protein